MKFIRLILAAIIVTAPPATEAAENRYDVLGKLLAPFISVLASKSKNPNRAVSLVAQLEQLTGASPEIIGTRAELALQFPDRLLVRGPILGENLAICRDRQLVWAAPGAKVQALLGAIASNRKLPPPDPQAKLAPLQLPLPEKQLVFLPALFAVQDAGSEEVDGVPCRVLDVSLMQELGKSLADKWSARAWVRPDYTPARLLLQRPGWELSVKFTKVEFAPSLPESTWQPSADDVLTLDAPRLRQLLRALAH